MSIIYRIHPSIGIARVGDASPDSHFIGPEIPGRSTELLGESFRDGGLLRRQGARFRVFAYDTSSPTAAPVEVHVGGAIAGIDWTVHLANKKAFWHEFNGPAGETSPDIPPASQIPNAPLRNFQAGETDAQRRARLIIDPRPRTIVASGVTAEVGIDRGGSATPAAETWPNAFVDGRKITSLGKLYVDRNGLLTVVGGPGVSGTPSGASISHYANNDDWFDDISDGPVQATIRFTSGAAAQVAESAWVIVGPPRFAPSVPCMVTMYDAMYDIAVRHHGYRPTLFDPVTKSFKSDYEPSFASEIYPILRSAELVGWVFGKLDGDRLRDHHIWNYTKLGTKPFPGGGLSPTLIFDRVRNPVDWHNATTADKMPRLHGDAGEGVSFLTLTQTQFHLLRQWKDGKFKAGGAPTIPAATTSITSDGLDRAALENCVGGAFFPGIEAGWILRDPRITSDATPFRIRVLGMTQETDTTGLTPGGATMRSALPWQADFYDCADQWWPSHRPTDVVLTPADATTVRWHRGVRLTNGSSDAGHLGMVQHWSELGMVLNPNNSAQPPLVERERVLGSPTPLPPTPLPPIVGTDSPWGANPV